MEPIGEIIHQLAVLRHPRRVVLTDFKISGQKERSNLMEEKQTLLAENTDTLTWNVEPFGIETIMIEE